MKMSTLSFFRDVLSIDAYTDLHLLEFVIPL